ncbi:MAG TPA: YbaK/EbsC family protein [Anaerolineales bacterium]|nr:YbaK/EbsC family protein [Anaerolineales bacterium]
MKILGPSDLEAYMQAQGIDGEILYLDMPTPTVEAAAQAVRTHPDHIVKSILFMVRGQPVLTISCGPSHVDRRSLAAHYNVGRKKVKLASTEAVQQETGYEVGAMPPFGHYCALPILIDRRVLEKDSVYAGGGAHNALLRLSPRDIVRVTRAEVIDLLTPPDE